MSTSRDELGPYPAEMKHPADSAVSDVPLHREGNVGDLVAVEPSGVKQGVFHHSLTKMREKNNDLHSYNQYGLIAIMGFGALFFSLFLLTQQNEGDVFLLPWRWGLVSLGTLAAWGLLFNGFAGLFILIYAAGTRMGGLVHNFIAAFDQYEIECSHNRTRPFRGLPLVRRTNPSEFYGAVYCLLGSACGGLGLYCWGLVLMKVY